MLFNSSIKKKSSCLQQEATLALVPNAVSVALEGPVFSVLPMKSSSL